FAVSRASVLSSPSVPSRPLRRHIRRLVQCRLLCSGQNPCPLQQRIRNQRQNHHRQHRCHHCVQPLVENQPRNLRHAVRSHSAARNLRRHLVCRRQTTQA